jgi:hypothetical protein
VENLGASSAECNDEDIMRNLREENISEVFNVWETYRANTAEINEFAYAHAMTCDELTDEDLLEIVQ